MSKLIPTFENMTLFCKPEQSGKTFLMIQQLINDLAGGDVVNFIFCDNNLLLTKQTSTRIANDLQLHVVNGVSYVEFSSRKENECTNKASVLSHIAFEDVRNIVCCTNGTRVNDICELIDKISGSDSFAGRFRFKIWLDEADKAIKAVKKFHSLFGAREDVELKCLTATPKALFDHFRNINVWALENTTSKIIMVGMIINWLSSRRSRIHQPLFGMFWTITQVTENPVNSGIFRLPEQKKHTKK